MCRIGEWAILGATLLGCTHGYAVKLNAIVVEMIAILQPESEGREVEWKIADLPEIECDPVLTRQVFQNLLANALKFTRPRGQAVCLAAEGSVVRHAHCAAAGSAAARPLATAPGSAAVRRLRPRQAFPSAA